MPLLLRYMIAGLIVILDQITKHLVNNRLVEHEQIALLPVFNITLLYNKGAAFSFLSDAGGWQRWLFTAVSLIVSAVLIVWLYRLERREKWLSLSIALILAGAIGNLIDRVFLGKVIDFIQVHYQGWYFPAFNIADSAITVGAAILLALTFFGKHEDASEQR